MDENGDLVTVSDCSRFFFFVRGRRRKFIEKKRWCEKKIKKKKAENRKKMERKGKEFNLRIKTRENCKKKRERKKKLAHNKHT